MTQPLLLVVLVGPNLVEEEAQRVLGVQEHDGSWGAGGDPGAKELKEAAPGSNVG